MQTPPDDFCDFESLIENAVEFVLASQDQQQFLAWMRDNFTDYLNPAYCDVNDDLFRVMAVGIGRKLWNAVPLPRNGFKPELLLEPKRNEPCFCGSGRKFKQCCASMPSIGFIRADEVWPIVVTLLSDEQLAQLLGSGNMPLSIRPDVAMRLAAEGHSKKAASLLESLFTKPVRKVRGHHLEALDVLCDCYLQLGYGQKKRLLLDTVIAGQPKDKLRAAAYLRLASVKADERDPTGAWEAFHQALRDDPESSMLGVIEAQLLMAEDRTEEAVDRARFWVRKLKRRGWDEDEMPIPFLTEFAQDPLAMMADISQSARGEDDEPLMRWIAEVAERPVKAYLVSADEPSEQIDLKDLLRSRFDDIGVDSEQLDSMIEGVASSLEADFDDAAELNQEWSDAPMHELAPPPTVKSVERAWRDVFPLSKPFSIHDQPVGEDDAWMPSAREAWTAVLVAHPEAFDSLNILDDLATAMLLHDSVGESWFDERLIKPVLERAEAIIAASIAGHDNLSLSWMLPQNRPALRSLSRLITYYEYHGNHRRSLEMAEDLLTLNPTDNHGYRAIVINDRLSRDDHSGVLALAEQFEDDMMLDVRMARVLALYRLGRLEEAEIEIIDTLDLRPKLASQLAAKRMKQPKIDDVGVVLGSVQESWLYRQDMRAEWERTPGALKWLLKYK